MKTVKLISLLVISLVTNAQNNPSLVCEQDRVFMSSCVMESRVFKPGVKVGFFEDCTNNTNPSKLFNYDPVPEDNIKAHFEDNGIPQNKLKDLILTVTGIENLSSDKNRRPLTFFIADGSDGNKYRYYISMPYDTINPTTTTNWCTYLVEEHEKFSKLIGRTIYGKNNLWSERKQNGQFETIWGIKYHPLEVTGIIPWRGVSLGAYYIRFKPQGSDKEYYRYCENSEDFFNMIFTFCDPKESFKNIKSKDWEAIQKGIPETGMKKEILELTIGKPDNVSTYKTNKDELELWYYKNILGKSYQIVFKKDKVDSISSSESNRRF